jgi:predicted dehydrogenase
MRIAIVGCGFVADMYMWTLPRHPELELAGVMDRDDLRAARFSTHHGVFSYRSFEELLQDASVELVLNLTNPRSHFEVTRACLLAGKHVYSEKPLAMDPGQAKELVLLAEQRGLCLSGAPSRVLGETAQTMWKALRDGAIGAPRLAYAEMDDGLLHKMAFKKWISASGAQWPYQDELEMGCTVEHAGYSLTWLCAFFGPAESVTAFSTLVIPDKGVDDVPSEAMAPDFSVACIRFASGVTARLTCSIVAPEDHSIRIFGDEGVLSTEDCWKPTSPVHLHRERRRTVAGRTVKIPWRSNVGLLRNPDLPSFSRALKKVDFCLGPLEVTASVRERRPCRLSARFSCHIAELTLAIHNAMKGATQVTLTTTFEPMLPMPWAR